MAAVTTQLCSALLFVRVFVFVSAEQKTIITADPGQNVTLTCRAPNNNNIMIVEWSRADLESDYVLMYRDEQFVPEHQHPSFKNRVDLQDRQTKDGDASLILKDVTTADTGTYLCRVFMEEARSWKFSIVYLRVVGPPGQPGENTEDGGKEGGLVGLIVGLSVSVVLLVVVFWSYMKHKSYKIPFMLIDDQELGQLVRSTQNCESDDLKRRRIM